MKLLYSCVLLLAVFAASQASDATWGTFSESDSLLSRQSEARDPNGNAFVSVDVVFPSHGETNPYFITCVKVIDFFPNSTGATPKLWSGGPGYNYVDVNLRSQEGKGLHSIVEVWGRR